MKYEISKMWWRPKEECVVADMEFAICDGGDTMRENRHDVVGMAWSSQFYSCENEEYGRTPNEQFAIYEVVAIDDDGDGNVVEVYACCPQRLADALLRKKYKKVAVYGIEFDDDEDEL